MNHGAAPVCGHDRRSPDALALLRAACLGRLGQPVAALPERAVRWAVETGLGPLLARAAAPDPDAAASPLWSLVEGATLTARILSAQQIAAMNEILDAYRADVLPPILLKGISLCEQHYPEPHLRPMRDLDFLVEEHAVVAAESTLRALGYRQGSMRPAAFYERHHHSSPFVHPDTGVWVDVHRALFASRGKLGSHPAFGPANIGTQLCWSEFQGRRVRRLSDELQIVHLACHWARGLRAVGGMVAMADVARLLQHNPAVDWELILHWTDASPAGRYVCLLLAYLHRHRIVDVPPEIVRRLHGMRVSPGHLTLRIAQSLLDRYVVGGQDFGLLMSERSFNRVWKVLVLGVRPARRHRLRPWRARRVPAAAAGRPGKQRGGPDGAADGKEDPGRTQNTVAREVMSMRRSDAAADGRTEGTSTVLYPRRRPGVQARAVDGEMLILDRQRQLVHRVNQTARFVWERCDGRHSTLHIADELIQAFDVDPVTAERDVTTVVWQLAAVDLVETTARWAGAEAHSRRMS